MEGAVGGYAYGHGKVGCRGSREINLREGRSAVRGRFGRFQGWLHLRSNSKGRFLEVGISERGKVSMVFVPGRRGDDPWSAFRAVLRRVVATVAAVECGRSRRSSGGVNLARSYRDAAVGRATRSSQEPPSEVANQVVAAAVEQTRAFHLSDVGRLSMAREEGRREAHLEAIKMAQDTVTEVARVVACEVAREYGRVLERENVNLVKVVRDLIEGFVEGLSKSLGLKSQQSDPSNSEILASGDGGIGFSGKDKQHQQIAKPDSFGKGIVESDGFASHDDISISSLDHLSSYEDSLVVNEEVGCMVNEGMMTDEDVLPFDSIWDTVLDVVGEGSVGPLMEYWDHCWAEDGKRAEGCTVRDSVMSCCKGTREGDGTLVSSFDAETQGLDPEGLSLLEEEDNSGLLNGAVGAGIATLMEADKGEDHTVSSCDALVRTVHSVEERCLPTKGVASVSFPREVLLHLAEIGCSAVPSTYQVQEAPFKVFSRKKKGLRDPIKGFLSRA